MADKIKTPESVFGTIGKPLAPSGTPQRSSKDEDKQKHVDALKNAILIGWKSGMDMSSALADLKKLDENSYNSVVSGKSSMLLAPSQDVSTTPLPNSGAVGRAVWQRSLNVNIPANNFGSVVYLGKPGPLEEQHGAAPTEARIEQYDVVDSVNSYYKRFHEDDKKRMVALMDKYYGQDKWDATKIPALWQQGVLGAATAYARGEKITPWDALSGFIDKALKSGTAPSSSGSGSTFRTDYNLSSESDARTLVDNALSQHLGRKATAKEQDVFYSALLKAEKANPSTMRQSKSGSTTTQGLNKEKFADEYAASQQGAGEYAAATTYLDTFLQSLSNPVNVAGV